jgi:hypothetical protein
VEGGSLEIVGLFLVGFDAVLAGVLIVDNFWVFEWYIVT